MPQLVGGGSWENCGSRMKAVYIPTPMKNEVAFALHTGRLRSIRISTSGSG